MIFTSSTAASAFCSRSQRARITVAWRHHQSINNRSATIALAFSGGTPMSRQLPGQEIALCREISLPLPAFCG